MAAPFTPGPWRVEGTGSGNPYWIVSESKSDRDGLPVVVAEITYPLDSHGWAIMKAFEQQANANLLSAAPNMYEALIGLFGVDFASSVDTKSAWNKARAALAKAEGRTS